MARIIAFAAVLLTGCDLGPLTLWDGGIPIEGPGDEDGGTSIIRPDAGPPPRSHPAMVEALDEYATPNITFTDVPGAVLAVTPASAEEVWVIFASGRIRNTRADDDASVLALEVDGRTVDHFTHRTTGGIDNWAGFFTFYPLPKNSGTHTVKLRLQANGGETAVDNVRLVAAPMPPGADFQDNEMPDEQVAGGSDLSLLSLNFTPERAGEYLLFARATQSALPGMSPIHATFEDRAPIANTSGAAQPVFFAKRVDCTKDQQSFHLRGSSSGGGAPDPDWWDSAWSRALPVTITAGDVEVPEEHEVPITFNHAGLVGAGWSPMNGADIRVVHFDGDAHWPVDFGLDEDSTWGDPETKIWIATDDAIPRHRADSGYRIYFSNPEADRAVDDITDVFWFTDDFDDGGEFDNALWTSSGAPAIDDMDNLILEPMINIFGKQVFPADTILEASIKVEPLGTSALEPPHAALLGMSNNNDSGSEYVGYSIHSGVLEVTADHNSNNNNNTTYHPEVSFANQQLLYGVARLLDGSLIFSIDDQLIQTLPMDSGSLARLSPLLRTEEYTRVHVAWVRIRSYLSDPPLVTVGAQRVREQTSTWRDARIIAFRADAFDDIFGGENTLPSTSTRAGLNPHARVEVPASESDHDHVVIAAARIAGAANAGARRDGVVLLGDQPVLETSHKIDADGSDFGYHHTAGFAGVLRKHDPFTLATGARSPDGIPVEIADSVIVVLRYRE